MDNQVQKQLADWLSEQTHTPFYVQRVSEVCGGCIHQAYVFESCDRSYFIKMNQAAQRDIFEAETEALEILARTATICVPRPIGCGCIGERSFLAMERLLFGSKTSDDWRRMGQELAGLHRYTDDQFGWHRDNFIGASPQLNKHYSHWIDFFREQRLRPQFAMAHDAGIKLSNTGALLDAFASRLEGHHPFPSLVHGDLWSGNIGFLEDGSPVIFDPACYFGDRETDIAFSEFFGGFPSSFYAAYEAAWPLPKGYAQRKPFYNLYHVLNHANLFGGHYIQQAQQMINTLIT